MPWPPVMRGVYRHEVVSIEHQTRVSARSLRAGDSVCVVVRTFPRGRCAGGTSHSIRPGAIRPFLRQQPPRSRRVRWACPAAARVRSGFRPATTERSLRDLRRYRAGQRGPVCDATAVVASAGRGIVIPDHWRRVRPSELRSRRFSASRSPHLLLTSIAWWPQWDRRVMRGRSTGG